MSATGFPGAGPLVFVLARVFRPRVDLRGKPEGAVWFRRDSGMRADGRAGSADDLLHARRMTLTKPSGAAGVTIADLSILKTGKVRAIRFSTTDALCRALAGQPGDILVFEGHRGRWRGVAASRGSRRPVEVHIGAVRRHAGAGVHGKAGAQLFRMPQTPGWLVAPILSGSCLAALAAAWFAGAALGRERPGPVGSARLVAPRLAWSAPCLFLVMLPFMVLHDVFGAAAFRACPLPPRRKLAKD